MGLPRDTKCKKNWGPPPPLILIFSFLIFIEIGSTLKSLASRCPFCYLEAAQPVGACWYLAPSQADFMEFAVHTHSCHSAMRCPWVRHIPLAKMLKNRGGLGGICQNIPSSGTPMVSHRRRCI